MRVLKVLMCAVLLAVSVSASPASAQTRTMTAQEQANLKLVSDWWREVLQAGHTGIARRSTRPRTTSSTTRISARGATRSCRCSAAARRGTSSPTLNPAPVIQFAKGDYVVFVWEREAKDPMDGTPTSTTSSISSGCENGRVAEHWDSVFKNPVPPGQPAPRHVTPGIGPKPVKPRNTPDEQKNEDLANIEFKDILQYGHTELAEKVMAPGYIQHNPNVPTGRAAFVEFFRHSQAGTHPGRVEGRAGTHPHQRQPGAPHVQALLGRSRPTRRRSTSGTGSTWCAWMAGWCRSTGTWR